MSGGGEAHLNVHGVCFVRAVVSVWDLRWDTERPADAQEKSWRCCADIKEMSCRCPADDPADDPAESYQHTFLPPVSSEQSAEEEKKSLPPPCLSDPLS